MSEEIGIKVFCAVEMTYKGTDFLIFGLDKEWYLSHPEIMDMERVEELEFLAENGAFIIQAHPYRVTRYIRLFYDKVHGVEIYNAARPESENRMARIYAENYNLIKFAGSDNHRGKNAVRISGMSCKKPLTSVSDFIEFIKNGQMNVISERDV